MEWGAAAQTALLAILAYLGVQTLRDVRAVKFHVSQIFVEHKKNHPDSVIGMPGE